MFSKSARIIPSRSGVLAATRQERPQKPGGSVTSAGRLRPRRIAAAAVLLAAPVLVPALHATSAQADSSCTTQIANRVNALPPVSNDYYPATLVIQREDNSWTSYSVGRLSRSSTGHLTGDFTQTYSDRAAYYNYGILRYQNFDISHPDTHSIDLSPTGLLAIHSYTWNVNSSADMTCAGALLTKYDAANRQMLTLTFGAKEKGIK